MGTSLSGLTPATTFDGLLKTSDNEPLDGTLKAISTGDGTDTILQLSNSALSIGGEVVIDSSGLNALIVKRSGNELLKSDGSGLNGALIFAGSIGNKFSLGVKGNDFNIWDGSYLGGGDLRFSILPDGKTGIGDQTPTAQLHIKGSGATSSTTSLLVQNSSGTNIFKVVDDNTMFYHTHKFRSAGGYLYIDGEANTNRSLRIGQNFTASSFDGHIFKTFDGTSYSEAMRITGANDQFVSIGETTPTARLHVKGSGNTSADYALKILNSDNSTLFDIRNDSVIRIAPNSTNPVSFRNAKIQDGNAVFGTTTIPASTRFTIKGSGTTSATTALLVQNSDGDDLIQIKDNGEIAAGNSQFTSLGNIKQNFYKYLRSGNSFLYLYNTSGNMEFKSVGDYDFYSGNSIISKLTSDGNLGIGETTPTARLQVKGSGTTSATTALLVQNSAGTDLLKVEDGGAVRATTSFTAGTSIVQQNSFRINQQWLVAGAGGQGLRIGTSNAGPDNSAKLEVDSTTQDFLPPRMTTTERDAISSPAAGLMVYNTTTNKAQCYNGTGWQDLF